MKKDTYLIIAAMALCFLGSSVNSQLILNNQNTYTIINPGILILSAVLILSIVMFFATSKK